MTGRNGEHPFDRWTWAHVASGLALGALHVPWLWMLIIVILYEGLEGVLRRVKLKDGGLFEYESWANIIIDILVAVVGYALAIWLVPDFIDWW